MQAEFEMGDTGRYSRWQRIICKKDYVSNGEFRRQNGEKRGSRCTCLEPITKQTVTQENQFLNQLIEILIVIFENQSVQVELVSYQRVLAVLISLILNSEKKNNPTSDARTNGLPTPVASWGKSETPYLTNKTLFEIFEMILALQGKTLPHYNS